MFFQIVSILFKRVILYILGDTIMADTHTFDIVCKVEMHEIKNAVDQARKQLAVRYDFKGSKSSITLNKEDSITLIADDDYKLQSLTDILKEKLAKRKVPTKALNFGK